MPRARTDIRAAGLVCGALMLAGCVVKPPASCVGVEPTATGMPLTVAQLQCEADRGDQAAAAALGRRFEDGDGVARDIERAAALYRVAAVPRAGTTQVYAPPVRLGGTGSVLTLPAEGTRGDPQAQYRLAMLIISRQVAPKDGYEPMAMLALAARQGYGPAAEALRRLVNQRQP